MPSLEDSKSPRVQLIHEWDRGFTEKKVDILAKSLHRDFHHIIHPRSLASPAIAKDEWLKNMKAIFDTPMMFSKPSYHFVLEAQGKVILHATAEVKGPSGIESRESIYIINIATDEGELKIQQIEEFTDSDAYSNLLKTTVKVAADE